MTHFSQAIDAFAKQTDQTNTSLACLTGLSHTDFSRWRRSESLPTEKAMAKLVAARVAWAAADNAVQIHGGNGFALETPISRILADARILNIFEGAGEIQAQVIARRLLETAN